MRTQPLKSDLYRSKFNAEYFSIVLNICETQYSSSYPIFRLLIKLGTKITLTLCIIIESETKAIQISDYLSYTESPELH